MKAVKSKKSTASNNSNLVTFVADMSAAMDKIDERLGTDTSVTAADKQRSVKPRKGAHKVLETLVPIVRQHGLDSPGLSSEKMSEQLVLAQTLRPLVMRIQASLERVQGQLFAAESESWTAGLQFYSLLQRRAKTDGALAANLDSVASFFAYRRPSDTRPTKLQTRAKSHLKKALAAAERHGVPVPHAADNAAPTATAPAKPQAPVAIPVIVSDGSTNGATNGAANGVINGVTNGAANGAGVHG